MKGVGCEGKTHANTITQHSDCELAVDVIAAIIVVPAAAGKIVVVLDRQFLTLEIPLGRFVVDFEQRRLHVKLLLLVLVVVTRTQLFLVRARAAKRRDDGEQLEGCARAFAHRKKERKKEGKE